MNETREVQRGVIPGRAAGVFALLPGLMGVTDEQISESSAAVDRLRQSTNTPEDV